ncbi:MAG: glycosyltransferase family 2 protein [Bacteroidales bacterium]|nr:glycosyltransferase family 2 protein [Bacteroidales bacterium]
MKLYKNGNPLVSVILPTYNRGDLIERALDSVFAQTFQDFELVLVDDGSNDNTCQLIQTYIRQHENIRYIKQQNMKLPLALNTGIQLSVGRYITFINSDDAFKPDHLEQRIRFMVQNPDVDLIHGGVEIVGNPYVKDKDDTSKFVHVSECVLGATFLGKRNVFIRLNGFKEMDYSEDSEFFERAERIFNVQKVSFPSYIYYRDAEDSITNNI